MYVWFLDIWTWVSVELIAIWVFSNVTPLPELTWKPFIVKGYAQIEIHAEPLKKPLPPQYSSWMSPKSPNNKHSPASLRQGVGCCLGKVSWDQVISFKSPTLFECRVDLLKYIYFRGCPRGVMVKAMNCGIVVREFVLQSRYYVHFRANTLGKGMNPLIPPPAMGK